MSRPIPLPIAELRARRPDLDALEVCEFAYPGPLRDALVGAILDGRKTATTGLVAAYEAVDEPLPVEGSRELVVDSAERVVAVVELTRVDLRAVGEVDLAIAIAEGEDYASVTEWRAGHDAFWTSDEFRAEMGQPDFEVGDDEPAVVIWFRVVETFTAAQ